MFYRGTTPVHTFIIPEDYPIANIKNIYVSYRQSGNIKLEKKLENATLNEEENKIAFQLTQEDTLEFSAGEVEIQIRMIMKETNQAYASIIFKEKVQDVIKNGVIMGV